MAPAVSTPMPSTAAAWAAALRRVTNYLGERFRRRATSLEVRLGDQLPEDGTFPLLAILIAWYHNTSAAAWIYLAMHGSYGLVWIIKDLAFPDASPARALK